MSDKKISQLPASTTPLAGTEEVAVVQSGDTKKVTAENIWKTTLPSGTVNGVVYLNGSKIATSGSSFVFDGTRVGIGTASPNVGSSLNVIGSTRLGDSGVNYPLVLTSTDATCGVTMADNGTTNDVLLEAVSNDFRISTGGNNTLRCLGTGDVQVFRGNLVIGTSGKGIDFSATGQAAGMTSELLSDYEEGTFTPTIVGQTTAGAGTYSLQLGRYTKVGNRVFFHLWVIWSAHDGTGNMRVGGLPFTSNTTGNNFSSAYFGRVNNIALSANNTALLYIPNNATYMQVQQYPVGGGAVSSVTLDTAGEFMIAGHYEV